MIKVYQRLLNAFSPWQIALLAAIGYGCWAGWVNSEYGYHIALKTGLIQGSYAFISTAIVTFIAQTVLNHFNASRKSRWLALFTSWSVMLAIPITLHTWQHTPDLLQAIVPGAIIGTLYLWTYCQSYNKNNK